MNAPSLLRIAASALALLFSACAHRHVPLDPQFFNTTSRRVGVALAERPVLTARRTGAQGLLDIAISAAADSNLENHLKTVDVVPLERMADAYVDKLKQIGFQARRINPERLARLKTLQHERPRLAELAALAKVEGVDSLILLSTHCGTTRSYYGFIPLTPPSGYCWCTGRLLDLSTGAEEWVAAVPEETATVPVKGDWDQPPDFPNLTTAVQQAMGRAQDYLLADFFSRGTAQATR